MLHLEPRLTGEADVGWRVLFLLSRVEPGDCQGPVEHSHLDHTLGDDWMVQKAGGYLSSNVNIRSVSPSIRESSSRIRACVRSSTGTRTIPSPGWP